MPLTPDDGFGKLALDVTVPVLNEEKRLEAGVLGVVAFLEAWNIASTRIVIVDNGSTDATTAIAGRLASEHPSLVSFLRIQQRGVGAAIRSSWTASSADIVGYMDVDLATDLLHLLEVLELFEQGEVKVVNGSRLLAGSVVRDRSLWRGFTSRTLNAVMRASLGVGFTDAMTGFKFFERQHALMLLAQTPEIPDWFVAAEMLVRSEWVGVPAKEIAIRWQDDRASKANVPRLARQYLGHILRLKHERRARMRDA